MKVKTKILIGVILAVLTALFLFGYIVGHRKGVRASQPTIEALNKEIQRTTVELNNTKLYVTSVEQELETIRQAKAKGDVTAKELRKLNIDQANEISRLALMIDTLLNNVDNNGQVVVIHDTVASNVNQNAIKLPFTFDKSDKFLLLHGMFNSLGKLDINLKMNVPVDVITGIGKDKKPIVVVSTPNPYVGVMSLNSIKTDTQKPKKIGIGIQAGYGFNISNPPKFSPYIGIGFSYNFLRF